MFLMKLEPLMASLSASGPVVVRGAPVFVSVSTAEEAASRNALEYQALLHFASLDNFHTAEGMGTQSYGDAHREPLTEGR